MKIFNILILFILFVSVVGGSQSASAGNYKIEKVSGNVYRFVADRLKMVFSRPTRYGLDFYNVHSNI